MKCTRRIKMTLGTLVIFGVLFLAYVYFVPKYALGNIFFGDVPQLYNLKFAHFFYNQALIFDTKNGIPPIYTHYQISRIHFIQGDLEAAMEEIDAEFAMYPDNAQTYYIKGLTLGYMKREEEAIDAFTQYIAFNNKSWAARNDKAWLQFRIGDFAGALETIEPVAHNIGNPWIQNTYGTLLMNHERYDEAEKAFLHAQNAANNLTEESWGKAYPGNDPRIYGTGLAAMRTSISSNLFLIKEKQMSGSQ